MAKEASPDAKATLKWWQWVVGRRPFLTVLRLALFYGVMLGLVYWFQDSLLYHPTKVSPEQELANASRGRYIPFYGKPGTPEFRGWLQKFDPGPLGNPLDAKGTVVVVHGNAGLAIWSHHYGQMLEPAGYNVMLYEYPGYASRDGKPSEATIVADLRDTIRRLDQENLGPIYLVGESLGCGAVSAAVADRDLPVAGVFLGTPWSTLPDVAAHRFWFLPARQMVRDQYDSVTNLAGFKGPVYVLLAEHDIVIPPSLGQRLYDSLPGDKRLDVFKAGHNTWFDQTNHEWWSSVMAFLSGDEKADISLEASNSTVPESAPASNEPN